MLIKTLLFPIGKLQYFVLAKMFNIIKLRQKQNIIYYHTIYCKEFLAINSCVIGFLLFVNNSLQKFKNVSMIYIYLKWQYSNFLTPEPRVLIFFTFFLPHTLNSANYEVLYWNWPKMKWWWIILPENFLDNLVFAMKHISQYFHNSAVKWKKL